MSRKVAREVAMKLAFARLFGCDDTYAEVLEKSGIKDVPSDAIQAMFVGLSQTIIYALTDEKIDAHKDVLNLLARCAIDSDKTLGYGLPPMDENKPEAGNIFTTLMQTLKDAKDEKGVFGDDKDVLNKFKQNISSIFDSIIKMVEKLKSDRKKKGTRSK